MCGSLRACRRGSRGVVLGRIFSGFIDGLRSLGFGGGSRSNAPVAILIWLRIKMMMEIDFAAIRGVGRRPGGLFITLFVN